MSTKTKRTALANIAGTLGYLSLVLQWMWSLVIFAYPVISGELDTFLFPKRQEVDPTPIDAGVFTPVVFVIAAVITLLVLVLTAIVIARLPKTIAAAGAHITKTAATAAIPIATHRKPPTKKQRLQLSFRFVIITKAALVVLPLLLLLIARPIEQLPQQASLAFGSLCAVGSALYFALQYTVVFFGRIAKKDVL